MKIPYLHKHVFRIWKYLLLSTIVLTLGQNPTAVKACSGGGSASLEDRVAEADYVAKVHVVRADDAGQNAILRVENYLVGGAGPQFLFIRGATPAWIERVYRDRNSTDECISPIEVVQTGDVFYTILKRRMDGSYFPIGESLNSGFLYFPMPTSTVGIYSESGVDNAVTESELIAMIADISGEMPTLPVVESVYPATAPLVITTSHNTDYLLPMDGRTPVQITEEVLRDVVFAGYMSRSSYSMWGERLYAALSDCPDIDCFTFSDFDIAFLPGNGRILPMWGWENELEGQEILFSPAAEVAAIWDGDVLNVYLLRYDIPYVEPQGLDYIPMLINSVALADSDEIPYGANYSAWSPDARLLAFSDESGLWLWDALLPDEIPQLLIPTVDDIVPYARYFSPGGRYLAIAAGDHLYNLDLFSGDELDNGIFSSNDRLLLALTPLNDAVGFYDFAIEQVAPPDRYIPFIPGTTVRQAEWQENGWLLAVTCTGDDLTTCGVLPMNVNGDLRLDEAGAIHYEGYSFATQDEALAVVIDTHRLLFNGTELNLSGLLDGEIARIRWLPSLFYSIRG